MSAQDRLCPLSASVQQAGSLFALPDLLAFRKNTKGNFPVKTSKPRSFVACPTLSTDNCSRFRHQLFLGARVDERVKITA